MSPTAYIGAASAAIIAVLGGLLYIKDQQATEAAKAASMQEIRALTAEQGWQSDREKWALQQEHANELAADRQSSARIIEQLGVRIDQEKAAQFSLALEAPVDAGDNFTSFLAWWMCEKERSGGDGQGTCDIHAPADTGAAVNFVQVFTPTVAEQWAELCEDGQKDFCGYVMVGFTWDGWHNMQNYLMRDLVATQGRARNLQYFEKVIEGMKND